MSAAESAGEIPAPSRQVRRIEQSRDLLARASAAVLDQHGGTIKKNEDMEN